ncbi:MAG TPA: Ig-like domain-containing protein [Candidatus Saccharimonadales bacterium]|nr:Ig-like domain-containing protein [Candidatus Saccharimonadales bacterium]
MTRNIKTPFRTVTKAKQVATLGLGALLVAGSSLLFLTNKAQAAACTAPSTDYGTATSTVKIDTTATYNIWSQMYVPDTNNNSYLLEVDGTNCFVVGDGSITPNTWSWVNFQNGTTNSIVSLNLSAGDHTVKMIGRESGVQLGRLLFLSDTGCVPTGTGSNCTVAADTTPPVVSLTTPTNGSTVSGTVNAAATATDNVGVTKVEFYVNGALAATDTSGPYTYAWNTTAVANGANTVSAKAYDAAGNIASSDVAQVTVNNTTPGDTQAPSVPTNVTATADAPNKVTVKWSASSDNVGVVGYIVSRNNVPVADVTSGTQYVDNSVLPGTKYAYQVSAYDAAKNSSAASTTATVTTPNPTTADTQAPTAPKRLNAQAVSSSQINLKWAASTDNVGVAAYDIYRSLGDGSGSSSKIATVTTTSYGDTGLAAGTQYAYFVKARDAAGNVSGESNTDAERTKGKATTTTGTLTGTVSYNSTTAMIGSNIAYAANTGNRPQITLRVNGDRHIYTVNSKGKYKIPNLPAGDYQAIYSAKGAKSQTVTVKIKAGKTTVQNITLH